MPIILVTGIQAAGKSTIAQALAQRLDTPDQTVEQTVDEVLDRVWTEAAA